MQLQTVVGQYRKAILDDGPKDYDGLKNVVIGNGTFQMN